MIKTSKIINKLVMILFVFILFLIAFIIVLSYGLSIKNIDILGNNINGIYLKLEDKLVLNIDNINIQKTNDEKLDSNLDVNKIKKTIYSINKFKDILLIFQEIKVDNLNINNQIYKIDYSKESIKVSHSDLYLDASVDKIDKRFLIHINKIAFKDIYFKGNLLIDKDISVYGDAYTDNLELNTSLSALVDKNKNIYFELNNLKVSDQDFLYTRFEHFLMPVLKEWLYTRVKFKEFNGNFVLHMNESKIKKILANGKFGKVAVRYNDKAPIAYTDELNADFSNFKLNLNAKNLTSEDNVKVDSFTLNIPTVLQPEVLIKIKANNVLYNKGIEKIINAYNVVLGFVQNNGSSNVDVDILISNKRKNNVQVLVDTKGDFALGGFKFFADAKVKVVNDKVYINGNAKADFLAANNINALINTTTKLGDINVEKLLIDFQDNFKYFDTALIKLNIAKKSIVLTQTNTEVVFDKTLNIKAKIKDVVKYSKIAQDFNVTSGDFYFTSNYSTHNISLKNTEFDLGIYEYIKPDNSNNLTSLMDKSAKKYNKDDFFINISNTISLSTKSNKVKADINNDKINVSIKDIAYIIDPNSNSSSNSSKANINLNFKNSLVLYDKFVFDFDKLNISTNSKRTILDGDFKLGGNIKMLKEKNNLELYLRDLQSNTLNQIVNKTILLGGYIAMNSKGSDFDNFSGLINVANANIANTKNYSNLLSFIETIPSLLSLNKPEFYKDGLGIQLSSIEFRKIKELIYLDAINIAGNHVDANGNGVIDTLNSTADLNLNLFTLKKTNSLIKNIPLVKEIIIGGKDNKIATSVKVYGKLDDLKFKTSLVKDILTSPIGLIKNIISLPVNLVNR